MADFTHLNEQERARMVDISDKTDTVRTARARSGITVSEEAYTQIEEGTNTKGSVLAVAQVAGIAGAKKTSDWIPMCHPLMLSGADIHFEWEQQEQDTYHLSITSEVKVKGNTGVEMEALTAATAAALTVYDMCKSAGKDMTIGPTYLLDKTGGKSGNYHRES
ncbi:cyclic pyranopterin monophosphate synthase MoaC [Salibacterium qingdaonense]|uniref:Cyclic pyranopterin monophosphate synthase n=1 Tax=Salibacterium qingdaonense TaxID=266892 RepID=A0A1I4I729_9BACI|nr:cyclic pyranopterin monophosphate synthase MoaC [Salibacterium qingdaonense]SFL49581.1 cyclic pyranopterin monophosphate synthase subunit MoaC [Salibacterium qingdaonense]